MDIYIERCIWCCLECMRIKHLQYDVNYKDYNNDDLNYNNDLNYNYNLDIKQHCKSTKKFSPSKSTSQKLKNNQSLVSNIISNNILQPLSSTTNDFIIDLPILKNEDDDGFELLEKNE